MRTIYYTLFLVLGVFAFSSCTKSNSIADHLNVNTKSEVDLDSYFQYETSDPMQVIELADSNYYNDLVKRMSSRQPEGPYFQIDYSGIYWECGDGSTECLPPKAPCAIIICQDVYSQGDIVTYTDADIIKYFAQGPELVSYSSIIVDKSLNQQSCNLNGTIYTSFIFEE